MAAQAMTGCDPEPIESGIATTPLDSAGTPSCTVVVYRMRHADMPSGNSPLYGSYRNSLPGLLLRALHLVGLDMMAVTAQ